MINISTVKEPTVPMGIKTTMAQIGLLTRAIRTSQINNPDGYDMEEYHNLSTSRGEETWWIALTKELFATVCPHDKEVPTTLPGNMMCPAWDKVILTPSPASALMGLFFHITEMHTQTESKDKIYILAFKANTVQMRHRLGANVVSLFNEDTISKRNCKLRPVIS